MVVASTAISILMTAPAFLVRTGVAFVPPVHPGDASAYAYNDNVTGPVLAKDSRCFKHDHLEYLLSRTVSKEMKQRILPVVPT